MVDDDDASEDVRALEECDSRRSVSTQRESKFEDSEQLVQEETGCDSLTRGRRLSAHGCAGSAGDERSMKEALEEQM